jgi:hypothetical protein
LNIIQIYQDLTKTVPHLSKPIHIYPNLAINCQTYEKLSKLSKPFKTTPNLSKPENDPILTKPIQTAKCLSKHIKTFPNHAKLSQKLTEPIKPIHNNQNIKNYPNIIQTKQNKPKHYPNLYKPTKTYPNLSKHIAHN